MQTNAGVQMSANTTAHTQMAIWNMYRGYLRPKRLYSTLYGLFSAYLLNPLLCSWCLSRDVAGTCGTYTRDLAFAAGCKNIINHFHYICYAQSAFTMRALTFTFFSYPTEQTFNDCLLVTVRLLVKIRNSSEVNLVENTLSATAEHTAHLRCHHSVSQS